MAELIMKSLMGIMLLLTAIQDLYYKKISTWIVVIGTILLCICIPFCKELSLLDRALGLSVGAGVMLTSKATGGKIGMGDGLLLGVTGIGLGFWENLELFALSLFAAAIVSIILLAFKLADRKKSIPFVPFLLIGYIINFISSRPWNLVGNEFPLF
ncbi:MAG TPA: A24 family peptidase [Mobilitalea sp.]|nr:A24 family peptidase [Mobilitalea sp.]